MPTPTPTRTPIPTPTATPCVPFQSGGYWINCDGTMTDPDTGTMWAQKTGTFGGAPNPADPNDANNLYTWSTGSPYLLDGTAVTEFLAALNQPPGFAGYTDWRLPMFEEMNSVLDCTTYPNSCLPTALGSTGGFAGYWTATSNPYTPSNAYFIYYGGVSSGPKIDAQRFFAVRGAFVTPTPAPTPTPEPTPTP